MGSGPTGAGHVIIIVVRVSSSPHLTFGKTKCQSRGRPQARHQSSGPRVVEASLESSQAGPRRRVARAESQCSGRREALSQFEIDVAEVRREVLRRWGDPGDKAGSSQHSACPIESHQGEAEPVLVTSLVS